VTSGGGERLFAARIPTRGAFGIPATFQTLRRASAYQRNSALHPEHRVERRELGVVGRGVPPPLPLTFSIPASNTLQPTNRCVGV
jgi:hypothetical protein